MVVFTQYLIINIALFVIIAYLVIQCYKDIKEILNEVIETLED
jgi:uncharacterized protein YoxC